MFTRKPALLIVIALLAGCAAASGPTYSAYTITLPKGDVAYRVTCYGLLEGASTCSKRADEICKGQPVSVLSGESRLSDAMGGKADDRNITFQCGAPAAAAPVPPAIALPQSLTLGADATFDTAQATLTPEACARLDELVVQALGVRIDTLTVNGYTDSIGSDSYNQDLSERRASAVAHYLQAHGLNADRFVSRGYGKANPVDSNATDAGRAKNRRVEVLMDVDKR